MHYRKKYELWLNSPYVNEETKKELMSVDSEKEIEDRFYKDLEFGTGGLRGVMGAGSNRMNRYTIGKATQGLAEYILSSGEKSPSVAIAYDSRNRSEEFALDAAITLCSNGIKTYIYESLRPTPVLSYTVRHLGCSAGIVVTASHNPKQYNGYKVYGNDGGQVTDKNAAEIIAFVGKIDDFSKVKTMTKEEAIDKGLLVFIGEEIDKVYIEKVKALTIREQLVKHSASKLNVIYTPIHGSGNVPVRRVLKELGYTDVKVVKEQELPDGNFPTASYPNPEEPKVFEIALNMAKEIQPDIIFGTDPDADRIGVVVKDSKGEYRVLTGNQTGVLLTNYVVSSLKELSRMPDNGTIIKTIVTTDMVECITKEYNAQIIDVLTGFKYIGEKIKQLEENNSGTFLFGFEESFGYLSGNFVRDKDAVIAAMLICEMALYYKSKNMSLYDGLVELYEKYGFYKEDLVSIELKGKEGAEKISSALEYLRHSMKASINGVSIVKKMDYKLSIEKDLIKIEEKPINLPKSNVLKFVLEDGSWFVVRPSGTEPKMKIYLSVVGESEEDSNNKVGKFKKDVMNLIEEACKG